MFQRKFQECFKEDSRVIPGNLRVIQGYFKEVKEVSRVFQESFKDDSINIKGGLAGALRVFQNGFKGLSQSSLKGVSRNC